MQRVGVVDAAVPEVRGCVPGECVSCIPLLSLVGRFTDHCSPMHLSMRSTTGLMVDMRSSYSSLMRSMLIPHPACPKHKSRSPGMPPWHSCLNVAVLASDARAHWPSSLAHAVSMKAGDGRKKMREAATQRRRRVWREVRQHEERRVWQVEERLMKSSMLWRWDVR